MLVTAWQADVGGICAPTSRTVLCAASRQGRSRTGALRFWRSFRACAFPTATLLNGAMVPFRTFVPLYNAWAGAQPLGTSAAVFMHSPRGRAARGGMFGPALGPVVALLRLQAFNGLGPLRQDRRFARGLLEAGHLAQKHERQFEGDAPRPSSSGSLPIRMLCDLDAAELQQFMSRVQAPHGSACGLSIGTS